MRFLKSKMSRSGCLWTNKEKKENFHLLGAETFSVRVGRVGCSSIAQLVSRQMNLQGESDSSSCQSGLLGAGELSECPPHARVHTRTDGHTCTHVHTSAQTLCTHTHTSTPHTCTQALGTLPPNPQAGTISKAPSLWELTWS